MKPKKVNAKKWVENFNEANRVATELMRMSMWAITSFQGLRANILKEGNVYSLAGDKVRREIQPPPVEGFTNFEQLGRLLDRKIHLINKLLPEDTNEKPNRTRRRQR